MGIWPENYRSSIYSKGCVNLQQQAKIRPVKRLNTVPNSLSADQESYIAFYNNWYYRLNRGTYLLTVRSLAKPNSLSTQSSESSFFLDLEDVLGDICWASEIVTILSKSSSGVPSAVHISLHLFSYITCDHISE